MTRRLTGARCWRAVVARVLVAVLLVSAVSAHVCVADVCVADVDAGPAVVIATGSAGGTGDGGTTPAPHGLVAHVTCGCHVGVQTAAFVTLQAPDSGSQLFAPAADAAARPSPLALPFEPPRA